MAIKSYIKASAFSALFAITSLGSVLGCDQDDDFVLLNNPQPVYKKVFIPQTLTYEQVRDLRTHELVIKSTHIEAPADQKKFLNAQLPRGARFISNRIYNGKYTATLESSYTSQDQHLSQFTAFYTIKDWFSFSVTGYAANLSSALVVKNIDAEAAEEDRSVIGSTLVKYGYDHPSVTHIKLSPEYFALVQQRMLFTIMQQAVELPEIIPEDNGTGLRNAMLHAGMYIFSFVAKPLIKKHVPFAQEIYPEAEGMLKILGYPTVTHFLKDFATTRKVNSPLLIEEDKESQAGMIGTKIIPRNEKLHAISRGLGYAASFIPGATTVRSLGTMYAERQGYPTLTHYAMGHKEMTEAQILEIQNNQTLFAEQIVAVGIGTFGTLGDVFVAISHTGAKIFLNKSSVTAYMIDKFSEAKSNSTSRI